ncbi:MAG TPA: hypothetical protein VFV33_01270 [Gemmatimonadaceae bacterium]|nr:hypothetical protein [Gemmatimonadaceae bacterium]
MALITEAQWRVDVGTAHVTDLTADDATTIAAVLEQASDFVQEYATAAGVTLTAGGLTAAMRRRVSVIASYYAADAKPEYRDAQGDNAYLRRYAGAKAELQEWADRIRSLSSDDVSEGPLVLSEDARGWNA